MSPYYLVYILTRTVPCRAVQGTRAALQAWFTRLCTARCVVDCVLTDTDSVAGAHGARSGGGCGVIGEAAGALADVAGEYGRVYDR